VQHVANEVHDRGSNEDDEVTLEEVERLIPFPGDGKRLEGFQRLRRGLVDVRGEGVDQDVIGPLTPLLLLPGS